MEKNSKILIVETNGFLEIPLKNRLCEMGFKNIVSHIEDKVDVCSQKEVNDLFSVERPDYVFLNTAMVNTYEMCLDRPAELLFHGLSMQSNVIDAANTYGVKKLAYLSSGAIYPLNTASPMSEVDAFSGFQKGPLQPSSIAKLVGMEMCRVYREQYGSNFICCIPTHKYGNNDESKLRLNSMIEEFIVSIANAKANNLPFVNVDVWGKGKGLRQFIHVKDSVNALIYLMETYDSSEPVNLAGEEILTVDELARKIASIIGYSGELRYAVAKKENNPERIFSIEKLKSLGFTPSVTLDEGILDTYKWYLRVKDV